MATSFASPTSSRTAIPFRTPSRCSRTFAARWKTQGAKLEVLGVATTGYAKDILKDVLKADVGLVETVAHTESALKFYEDPARDRRRGRPGHQAHHPQRRPREGFQAQHAVLGRQRLLPAIHRRRVRPEGRGLCRSGFLRAIHAAIRLWLRRFHAVGHREFPAPGLAGGGNSGRTRRRAARRTFSSTSPAFRTLPRSARASCCKAARRTISPS